MSTAAAKITFDEGIGEYHDDREYLGSSILKDFENCPLLLRRENTNSSSSAALALGTHWHSIRELGWERWMTHSVEPVPDHLITASGAMSTGREARAWLADLGGRTPLAPADLLKLKRMESMFEANPLAVEFEKDAKHREPSVRWESEGVKVRCRPDLITKGGLLIDYKTISEANPLASFRNNVRKYKYGLSAALYEEGCKLAGLTEDAMIFVVTSTVPPFATQVMQIRDNSYWEVRLPELLRELKSYLDKPEEGWLPRGYGAIHEVDS